MHPIYRWGGSYPYHANPMHYAPNDDPRAKEISSHMKMDPSTLSSPYQPWPYGGNNYCYPGPQECHGGYNHGYFGGPYSFQPPYPYYPPPPPSYHTHGFYPPFPGAYPAYSFPPPHYSVEQPRYDYDKNAHGYHHCCGCNHQEDDKKSRIEQEEPEIEKKTSNSLIPFLLKDYPYPIMWVPPGLKNTESKVKEKEKHSHDHVPLEPLEPSKQGGNGETDRDQQGGDDNRLPFPIFWFPSKNNEVGEKNVDLIAQKGSPFSRNDDKKRQTRINNEAEPEMGSKPAVQKVIPVKQLGTEEEKKSLKSMETKAKSGSVEKTDNGMEGKASPKTSKLPPVCLRIDPLPRKKNSSRSPSPPGDKGRSKGSSIDESKSSQQQTQLSEGLKKGKEEQSESNIKTIKTVERDSLADPCENVPSGEGNGSEKGIVCKAEKKKLSENEAALIIQSACRGFQVRKSNPITKLRQIREVGKQVIELRNRIQDSSSICIDNKQKLIIGETIMSLLLKLDTIQGLHPVVREVRKWVAKELVGLQEKLDSVKSETPTEDNTKREEDDDDGITIQEKSETPIEDSTKKREDDDDGITIQEKSETPIEDSTRKREDDDDGITIQEKSETPIEDSAKREEDDDGITIQEKSETPIEDSTKKEEEDDDDGITIQEKSETPIEDSTKKEEDDITIQEKSETPIEDSTKKEEDDDDDGITIQEKSETPVEDSTKREEEEDDETQFKVLESEDAEGGGLTNLELQNEESSGEVDKKNEVEVSVKSKQAVDDDDDDDVIIKDKFGESGDAKVVDEMEQKVVEESEHAMEAETIEIVEFDTTAGAEASDMNLERDCEVEVEESGMVDDVKKVMEEVVKEQMGVIRELTERVKDLESKLSKNNNKTDKINKKKKNKGRRSRGCIVEEELS